MDREATAVVALKPFPSSNSKPPPPLNIMLSQYNRSILSARRQELKEQLAAEKQEILMATGDTFYLNTRKLKALNLSYAELSTELAEVNSKLA